MYVPSQWKTSLIVSVPKVPQPTLPSDFRPISLSSILSRILERLVVQNCFYPLLTQPSLSPMLSDQFAFRPTGSTTAAIIFLLHTVSNMLLTNPFVHIVALDFSKAFDTVKHNILVSKMHSANLPDPLLNWVASYLEGRGHRTKYANQISDVAPISASVVQGSAVGPVSFLLYASDLHAATPGNVMAKYADDSYLIVPASNSSGLPSELKHIADWASNNGLKLNSAKTTELLVCKKNFSHSNCPPPLPGLERVTELTVLGVILRQDLSMSSHVQSIVSKGSRTLYALKTLKAHGLAGTRLESVCHATLIPSVVYASPAWWGFTNKDDQDKLQSLFNKAVRWGFISCNKKPSVVELCDKADLALFSAVLNNTTHVLHQLLPPTNTHQYSLRNRPHNRCLPIHNTIVSKNFIHRLLYRDVY